MKKACIFVDGENFRHSIKALFQNGRFSFKKGQYLPNTDWHHFYEGIANNLDCELLRTYWYVVEQFDFRPYEIPFRWDDKDRLLRKWYARELDACPDVNARQELLLRLEKEIEDTRDYMQKRAHGWYNIQCAIENDNDLLEFRRSGSIRYDLVNRKFGTEKAVDTQLTTDMIELASIYDVAIILTGDSDYLPPVHAVKRKGRLVYSVSFLDRKGKQLPGGARRLSNAVDRRLDLPFEAVRKALSIEPREHALTVTAKAASARQRVVRLPNTPAIASAMPASRSGYAEADDSD